MFKLISSNYPTCPILLIYRNTTVFWIYHVHSRLTVSFYKCINVFAVHSLCLDFLTPLSTYSFLPSYSLNDYNVSSKCKARTIQCKAQTSCYCWEVYHVIWDSEKWVKIFGILRCLATAGMVCYGKTDQRNNYWHRLRDTKNISNSLSWEKCACWGIAQ